MLLTVVLVITGIVGAAVVLTEVNTLIRRRRVERRWQRDHDSRRD
jgi:hypothetical protein